MNVIPYKHKQFGVPKKMATKPKPNSKTRTRKFNRNMFSGLLQQRKFSFAAGAVVAVAVIFGSQFAYYSLASTPEIASGRAGYCLDDRGDATANGSPIDIWTCNGSAAQHWSANGYYFQINGKCMDAKGQGTANGTPIILYTCNYQDNQKWNIVGTSPHTRLVNVHANKCLDDTGWGNNGTQLELYTCNGGANQEWYLSNYAVSNGGGNCGSGYHASAGCAQSYAYNEFPSYGWNPSSTAYVSGGPASGSGTFSQYTCLVYLWNHESGWQWNAYNGASGAYGIPQALPASKMAKEGSDYSSNAFTQVRWGLDYIKRNSAKIGGDINYDQLNGSYVTTPCQALQYENYHNSY